MGTFCAIPDRKKAIWKRQFMCVLPLLYANSSFLFGKFLIYGLILYSIAKFINFLRIISLSTAKFECLSIVFARAKVGLWFSREFLAKAELKFILFYA